MGTNHYAKVEEEIVANYTPQPLPGFKLVGEDGNAFFIMGRWGGAARKAGIPQEVRDAVMKDAQSGDYSHLLCVFVPWVQERKTRKAKV